MISEWDHDETDASNMWQSAYSKFLMQFNSLWLRGSWGGWCGFLAGSSYIRSGVPNSDKTYGKLVFSEL